VLLEPLTFFDLILACNHFDTALLSLSTNEIFFAFRKKINQTKKRKKEKQKMKKTLISSMAFLVSVMMFTSIAFAGGDGSPDGNPSPFEASVFTNLDYGLYWFGNNYNNQKAVKGKYNRYFSESAPTVIYVHGWQNKTTKRMSRECFNYKASGAPDMYFAQAWIDDGWNVGVFYWNQMADEGEVQDAEAKIWTTNGPRKMRWRRSDGSYRNDGPSESASYLFFQAYRDAMKNYRGDEIRIVGHSLGNQMAVCVTQHIKEAVQSGQISSQLLPDRVALLDPFYSKGGKDFLGGKWTGEVARGYVSGLIDDGVLFELYRTSGASSTGFIGDTNSALTDMTAFTELKPWYFGWVEQANKHIAAVWHYFWSYSFSPPSIKGSHDDGASAITADGRIAQLMRSSKKLVHDQGAWTKTPEDDRMKYVNR